MQASPFARTRLGLAVSLGVVACLGAGFGAGAGLGAESAVVVEQLRSQGLPGLRADVATLIMQGASGGAIDMAVAANLERETRIEGKRRMSLVVEVSGASLLAAVESAAVQDTLVVEFYAYVVDTEGLVTAHLARQVVIHLNDWGERISSGGIRFVEELEVPDGKLSIRSLVLIPDAGRFGMTVSEVGHDGSESGGVPGRPRFEDSCADWVPVVTSGSTAEVRWSALPLWRAGEQVTVSVALGGGSESSAPVFGVLESSSGEVARIEAAVEGSGLPLGGAESTLSFQVPNVEVGVYSFTVARPGELRKPGERAESEVESAASEVWIVPAPGEAAVGARPACAWPEVMQEARQLSADIAPITLHGAGWGSRRRKFGKPYVDLLRGFGDGQDLGGAVDALVAWEVAAVGDDVQKNLATILAVQVEVSESLARVDPESLLPQFSLHQAAYQEHFKRRNFGLAGHSRRMAAAIAEIWLARPDRGEEAGWVADALVSLGETADVHLMYAASQGFLERALEVDPKNRAGRLLLSMLYEKLGEYEAAADHLEQLVANAPADAEGWLRLATIQRRLGRTKASRDSLRRVIGQRPRPWILSLAYQTLVKELYAEERFEDGLRALVEAEFVLPSDSRLGLARAYGLDRLGRGREAVEVLERLPHGSDEGTSFRLFYAQADRELARSVAGRLQRNVLIRQSRLSRALTRVFAEAE